MPAKLAARARKVKNASKASPIMEPEPPGLELEAVSTAEAEINEDEEEGSEEESDEEEVSGDESGEDEEYDGVDEAGMKRLMEALGEDGLDEVGRMQLDALEGGGEEDSEEDVDGSEENDEQEKQEQGDSESKEDEEAGEADESEPEKEVARNVSAKKKEKEREDDGEEEEEIALEDADSIDEDAVPRQKLITNNELALKRIRESMKLDPSLPWTETLTVTYPETIEADVNDDLNRELAFYKQALHGATTARTLAAQHSLPFTRPSDYFAEMVKSDAHMERIRQRLLDESASIKRAELKRKEREGKKYGKQVQIEKMKERERSRKEMEERLKGLKRKHKDALDTQGDDDGEAFDVAVEDAISDRPHPSKRSKSSSDRTNRPKNLSRNARNAKFGFGGKGRREKQNTRESTEKFDFSSGAKEKGKGWKGGAKGGKPKRPGKSRRAAMRNR